MIASISADVSPFFGVILLAMATVALSFSVLVPGAADFAYDDPAFGVLKPFLTA